MNTTTISATEREIASQPSCWSRAIELAPAFESVLPQAGETVAVVGCGTSWFIAQAYATLRENLGLGVTDAFAASHMPAGRTYDRILAITRSGTTTEVLDLMKATSARTVVITGDPTSPAPAIADDAIVLDFADETSVVQTRFATTALMLLRAHLGEDLAAVIADGERAIIDPIDDALITAEQFTFLGQGWAYGLAREAALKMREAAGAWTESYLAMEYRHGPISIAAPGRVVWALGSLPVGLNGDVDRTGAHLETAGLDPVAELVRIQRLAVLIAESRGLNPDTPRNLTRSVILG
ncbi:SIS domain-containing protein [Microbacterium sp. B2969]|uniref:SIS domain-containing protein n=1 Tax=Microbacterium alkaliflavum TaxID=3248839 RepID=A0ABW7Q524_9MICO